MLYKGLHVCKLHHNLLLMNLNFTTPVYELFRLYIANEEMCNVMYTSTLVICKLWPSLTNSWVLEQAGVNRHLLATVKSTKLRYFGHIMSGEDKSLAKGIIEGTLPGNRKRGRPKTAWIDNVTSWTGLKLEDTIRKVDGMENDDS